MELTDSEKKHRAVLDKFSERISTLYRHLILHRDFNSEGRLRALNSVKKPGSNGEQFGYIHNGYVGMLYILITRLKKKSLIDLGSGAGMLLACLHCYDAGLKLAGIEIEDELLEISDALDLKAKKKDLLHLEESDIRDFEIVYFWEPIGEENAVYKFVNNLAANMYRGQILIMRPFGRALAALQARNDLKEIRDDDFYTFGVYRLFIKE